MTDPFYASGRAEDYRRAAAARIAADEAIAEALLHGCTLEGLQEALTRRLAADRLSPRQGALDEARAGLPFCFHCGALVEPLIRHVCSSEV